MANTFLTAEWRKLVMVNYDVPSTILEDYLPYGTELDFWEGKCYVSLVGFMFMNTRVKGCKMPGHINFEEVNLRFYVIRKDENGEKKRGVVFIKEIVPKPLITMIANKVYKENYETRPMEHHWKLSDAKIEVGYRWYIGNQEQRMFVEADSMSLDLIKGSKEEFITEHYWGYAKAKKECTNEYQVKHPPWKIYPVKRASISVDFDLNYGSSFAFLNAKQPASVFLAEGSQISVGSKTVIA